jgi:hypothetical protein
MAGGFKRSKWYGLIAVFVVAAVVVERRGGEQQDWLCDLWLAERLAAC